MSSLKVYSPFDNTVEDMLQRILRPMQPEWDMPQIKLDVTENDASYLITADLPGVKKEDIQLTVHGNLLSISAETQQEKEETTEGKQIRRERHYGHVYRSITFDQDIDAGHCDAQYENGVLKLTLPKQESSGVRRLTIR